MKLTKYLQKKNRAEFAEKIGTTKGYLDLICSGARRPSPDLALKIEKASNGQVNRIELLYPEKEV